MNRILWPTSLITYVAKEVKSIMKKYDDKLANMIKYSSSEHAFFLQDQYLTERAAKIKKVLFTLLKMRAAITGNK